MIARLAGASFRAALVAVAVILPAVGLPDVSSSAADLAILGAAMAAAFVILEYGSTCPSLIEFRFATPYNRLRFVILVALLFTLTAVFRQTLQPTGPSLLMGEAASLARAVWDFDLSPVRQFGILARPLDPQGEALLATAAAMALSVTVLALAMFSAVIVVFQWPLRRDSFNPWTNLPGFDAQPPAQTQKTLRQSALMSVLIGLALPGLAPQAAYAFMGPLQPVTNGNSLFLVWMIAIWCFVPAASLLRAVALYKLAYLLAQADLPEGGSALS